MKKLDLKSLDIIANSNEPLDKSMHFIDYAYCIKMRELYNDYRKGSITLDSCKKLKKEIVEEYQKCSSCLEVYTKYQDNLMQSEILRAEVNKSSDLQEMLLKSLKIVSLLTGDETFYKINARKVDK